MAAAALTENLYKAVRELRLVDPDPGPHGALNQARAQVAHTQMVIRNALTISDIMGIVFSLLRNPLDPRDAVAFGSTSPWLWAQKQIQELLLQLRAHQEDAAGLCHKLEMDGFSSKSCKNLRLAKNVSWKYAPGMLLSEPDFKMLGQLSSALPALKVLRLSGPNSAAGCEGGQLLAEGLGVGALPELIRFGMRHVRFSDAGASLLAAALGRGALARLECLHLTSAGIGDAGLVALAPALRRLIAINIIIIAGNPFGDEGIAALVAPPREGAWVLSRLSTLALGLTQVTATGCATLVDALKRGALPALKELDLTGIALPAGPSSAAARAAVARALTNWTSNAEVIRPAVIRPNVTLTSFELIHPDVLRGHSP